jgi:hypothetical protein
LDARVEGKGYQGFRRKCFRLVVRGDVIATLRLNGVEQVEQALRAGTMEFENRGESFVLEMTLA